MVAERSGRVLIVGGGIGGLAAAVALRRVGIKATVFEKTPRIAEVGAGLSLWSNAVLALRRLGVEGQAVAAGSVVERSRSFFSDGTPAEAFEFADLTAKAGAPSICVHRAALQRILLEAATEEDRDAVQTGRECIGFDEDATGVVARFADGGQVAGEALIGADGLHSVVRTRLFGDEPPRFAGYLAWRGIARGAKALLRDGEPLIVIAPGSQAGCFHCGEGNLYWFVTRNAPAAAGAGTGGKAEVLDHLKDWAVPFRQFVEATDDDAILRNDIADRPARKVWGVGRASLLGDAIHATTPNLGQGACQALEDAVILADCLRRSTRVEDGLREYEARRESRTRFVVEESRRLGRILQWSNPGAVWLRGRLIRTAWARRQSETLFDRLLCMELPDLNP